jgi:uncharacterized repeat protein (TIGR02543 family)
MKKTVKHFFGLILFSCLFFTVCENPVMKTWWEEPKDTFGIAEEKDSSPVIAQYKIYAVNFEANGGDPAPAKQLIVEGQRIAKVSPMRKANYGFGGWFTEPSFEKKWRFSTDRVNSDLTLYAKWDPIYYTVTFNEGYAQLGGVYDGNPLLEPLRIASGALVPEPTPLRRAGTGYRYGFGGWYKDPAFTQQWNFASDIVTSDMTLYAKWEDQSICSVIFQANNGSPAPRIQDVLYGYKVTEPLAMTRTGFGFGGWYKDSTYKEQWDFANDTVSSDMVLYALWVTNYYIVSFEANGGSPVPRDQVVIYDSFVERPAIMRKTNMGFEGWYTTSNFAPASEWNFDTDTVTSGITLYAKWADAHYDVIFHVSTGSAPSAQDIPIGGRAIEPPAPARDGYSFYGWYTASTYPWGNEWDFNTTINDLTPGLVDIAGKPTLNLYALWVHDISEYVFVRGGKFTMGGISGSLPAHEVTLSGFYIGKYPVTQKDYLDTMGANPSHFNSFGNTVPVECVSWFKAVEYCNALSASNSKAAVYTLPDTADWDKDGYRLPTEAEWEYAARGGNGSPGNFNYAGSNNAEDVAWFNTNSGGQTKPVGQKAPNALGIYDMNGNVSEWCWDWYGPYSGAHEKDPKGPAAGTERVRRGGAWSNSSTNVRSLVRNSFVPTNDTYVMGFRVARSPNKSTEIVY